MTTVSPAASVRSGVRGGEWLLTASDAGSVFTPEQLTEEHQLIAQTVTDFVNNEVLPVLDSRLWPEMAKNWGKMAFCVVGNGKSPMGISMIPHGVAGSPAWGCRLPLMGKWTIP